MAGLGVLLECNTQKKNSNNHKILSKTLMLKPHSHPSLPSFLEACNLCSKKLSYEKDIYMYRSDGAFCSVECRDRQIFMDEENMWGESWSPSAITASSKVATHHDQMIKNRAPARTNGLFAHLSMKRNTRRRAFDL